MACTPVSGTLQTKLLRSRLHCWLVLLRALQWRHPDLDKNVKPMGLFPVDDADMYGHGTHVTGIIGGVSSRSEAPSPAGWFGCTGVSAAQGWLGGEGGAARGLAGCSWQAGLQRGAVLGHLRPRLIRPTRPSAYPHPFVHRYPGGHPPPNPSCLPPQVGNNGIGIVGTVPRARITGCRALDSDGVGSVSAVVACLDQCRCVRGSCGVCLGVVVVRGLAGWIGGALGGGDAYRRGCPPACEPSVHPAHVLLPAAVIYIVVSARQARCTPPHPHTFPRPPSPPPAPPRGPLPCRLWGARIINLSVVTTTHFQSLNDTVRSLTQDGVFLSL